MKSEQEVLKQAYLPHHQPANINQVHHHRGVYYVKYYGLGGCWGKKEKIH